VQSNLTRSVEKRPPKGGQRQSTSHVATWPLYITPKNETATSSERHTVLVSWESLAENLGGGGQRSRVKLKSDWVTGGSQNKKAPSHYNWGLDIDI
jgi:hypothetical protein